MFPLPTPIRNGSLAHLRDMVNVGSDGDWALLLGWLVQALRPSVPYPILVLHGEQGSAKSTVARILRRLVDPNKAELRGDYREARDLAIAATNGWFVVLDNLSHLSTWLSDALCRLSTGGGFGTRMLYANDEEILFDFQRPIILTGIEELALDPDRRHCRGRRPRSPEPPERYREGGRYRGRPAERGAAFALPAGRLPFQ